VLALHNRISSARARLEKSRRRRIAISEWHTLVAFAFSKINHEAGSLGHGQSELRHDGLAAECLVVLIISTLWVTYLSFLTLGGGDVL
jgi:hypothetical protein